MPPVNFPNRPLGSISPASGTNQPPTAPTQIPLILGNFTFDDFELPERLDKFGNYQALAEHRFPGGQITIQELGAFPPKLISWSGVLQNYNGVDLNQRCTLLQQMIVGTNGGGGQPQQLSFGPFQYMVLVKYFFPTPTGIFRYPYTIGVVPYVDMTQAATAPPPSTTGIASLQQSNASLASIISNPPTVVAPSASQTAALTQFQTDLNNALQQALGNPALVNTPTLQASLNNAQSAVQPTINAPDGGLSAFSLQTNNTLSTINTQLNPDPNATILNTVQVVNPNLQQLAEFYYAPFGGSASDWPVIAQANQLMGPFPVGTFTLTIPALPM